MKPFNLTFDAKSGNLRQLFVLFVITICIVLSRKTAPAAEPGASNAAISGETVRNDTLDDISPVYVESYSILCSTIYAKLARWMKRSK